MYLKRRILYSKWCISQNPAVKALHDYAANEGGGAPVAAICASLEVAIPIQIDEFCIRNDGFCIESDGFCIQNDGY